MKKYDGHDMLFYCAFNCHLKAFESSCDIYSVREEGLKPQNTVTVA